MVDIISRNMGLNSFSLKREVKTALLHGKDMVLTNNG